MDCGRCCNNDRVGMASGGGDKFRCLDSESSDTSLLMEVSGAGADGSRIRKLGAAFREDFTGLGSQCEVYALRMTLNALPIIFRILTISSGTVTKAVVTERANQVPKGSLGMKLNNVGQAWLAVRDNLACPFRRVPSDHSGFATFQTYRKFSSVAVATTRLDFRTARLKAERTFSLLETRSAKGTFKAEPSPRSSRSHRIAVTIFLCFPLRD